MGFKHFWISTNWEIHSCTNFCLVMVVFSLFYTLRSFWTLRQTLHWSGGHFCYFNQPCWTKEKRIKENKKLMLLVIFLFFYKNPVQPWKLEVSGFCAVWIKNFSIFQLIWLLSFNIVIKLGWKMSKLSIL